MFFYDAGLLNGIHLFICCLPLKEHGVDKIYKLEPGKPLSDCDKYDLFNYHLLCLCLSLFLSLSVCISPF